MRRPVRRLIRRPGYRLVVDPIACDGTGVCAELLPEMITLDPWGFPIVDRVEIPAPLLDHARRAAASCPRLALTLTRTDNRDQSPVSAPGGVSHDGDPVEDAVRGSG